MLPVESSAIARIGYDAENGALVVEFTTGRTYIYSDVPEEAYAGLLTAESKGSYFNREVAPHHAGREI